MQEVRIAMHWQSGAGRPGLEKLGRVLMGGRVRTEGNWQRTVAGVFAVGRLMGRKGAIQEATRPGLERMARL